MFAEQLIERDEREYKYLLPLIEEASQLRTQIEELKAPRLKDSQESIEELQAKVLALLAERAELYKGQSATAGKLLDLSEALKSKEIEIEKNVHYIKELQLQVEELKILIEAKDRMIERMMQQGRQRPVQVEFESIEDQSISNIRQNASDLVMGFIEKESILGFDGENIMLNDAKLPINQDATKLSAIHMNDTFIVAGFNDGTIVVWSRQSLRIKHLLFRRSDAIIAVSIKGSLLVTGQINNLTLWDLESGQVKRVIDVKLDSKIWLTFLEDGRILAVLGRGKVKVLTAEGNMQKSWFLAKCVHSCNVQDPGNLVAFVEGDLIKMFNHSRVTKSMSSPKLHLLVPFRGICYGVTQNRELVVVGQNGSNYQVAKLADKEVLDLKIVSGSLSILTTSNLKKYPV